MLYNPQKSYLERPEWEVILISQANQSLVYNFACTGVNLNRKTVNQIGSIMILLVAGLVLAGNYFDQQWIPNLAVFVLGIIAMISGVRIMIGGEVVGGRAMVNNPGSIERYKGGRARLKGLLIVLSAGIILALSVVDLFTEDGISAYLGKLLDSSIGLAILLGFTGLIILAFGIASTWTESDNTSGYYGRLEQLEIKVWRAISLFASASTAVGIVMLLVAIGILLAPELLKGILTHFINGAKDLLEKLQ